LVQEHLYGIGGKDSIKIGGERKWRKAAKEGGRKTILHGVYHRRKKCYALRRIPSGHEKKGK